MRRFYYFFSLLFVFLIPTLIEGYFVWDQINMSQLLIFVSSITILGSLWDIWATRHGKRDPVWLWKFNRKNTIGLYFFDIPIEEFLFYIASSTYVVFLWEGIKYGTRSGSMFMLILLSFLGVWSLLAILTPYTIRSKKDRVI